tara:strand:- start:51 stop:227 length:177 start_codon:yes stop_codon:yes gene_type:complete
MTTYKLIKNTDGSDACNEVVLRTNSDGTMSFIPFNEENEDYLSYKEWLNLGNTPDPAD